MGVLSVPHLADAIGKMRLYIRQERGHVDVRSNSRVSADFAEYLRKLPKSKPQGEVPAAEEFEGDEVDPRDVRAAKRARRGEEVDPTYRGPATDRYDEAGLGKSTRAATTGKKAPAAQVTDTKPDIAALAAANVLAAQRPAPPTMDRPMPQWYPAAQQHQVNGAASAGFGTVPPSMQSTNPYTQRYTDSQPHQQYHPSAYQQVGQLACQRT